MSNLVSDSLTISNYVGVINTSRVDRWLHKKDGLIVHYSGPGVDLSHPRCVAAVAHRTQAPVMNVSLRPCNATDPFQQWTFGTYTQEYEQLTTGGAPAFPDKLMDINFRKILSGSLEFEKKL